MWNVETNWKRIELERELRMREMNSREIYVASTRWMAKHRNEYFGRIFFNFVPGTLFVPAKIEITREIQIYAF